MAPSDIQNDAVTHRVGQFEPFPPVRRDPTNRSTTGLRPTSVRLWFRLVHIGASIVKIKYKIYIYNFGSDTELASSDRVALSPGSVIPTHNPRPGCKYYTKIHARMDRQSPTPPHTLILTFLHPAVGAPPPRRIGDIPAETRQALPTFTPATGTTNGLDLLAAAAHASSLPPLTGSPTAVDDKPQLHARGPYNPGASLSTSVLNKILAMKFVEMCEVTAEDPPPGNPGRPTPAKLPITDFSLWLEKYSVMAAVLAQRFPEKAPELFAYQAHMIRCERNYQSQQWVAYDRRFRKEALAAKSLDWSIPNQRLFQEAFTGRAKDIPRCTYCLEDDHLTAACPSNPHRPIFGWPPNVPPQYSPMAWSDLLPPQVPNWCQPLQQATNWPNSPQRQVCLRYNNGKCKLPQDKCKHIHVCSECGGTHRRIHCTQLQSWKQPSRSQPTWPQSFTARGGPQAPTTFQPRMPRP